MKKKINRFERFSQEQPISKTPIVSILLQDQHQARTENIEKEVNTIK